MIFFISTENFMVSSKACSHKYTNADVVVDSPGYVRPMTGVAALWNVSPENHNATQALKHETIRGRRA